MDGSSASSALFDRPNEEPGNNAFAVQLKKLYRGISALGTRILKEDADENAHDVGRIVVQGRGKEITDEDPEIQKWNKLISDHKQYVLSRLQHIYVADVAIDWRR
jgi:protein SMG6